MPPLFAAFPSFPKQNTICELCQIQRMDKNSMSNVAKKSKLYYNIYIKKIRNKKNQTL